MKRFERSNGLDTSLYKNYLYLFVYLLYSILTRRTYNWSLYHAVPCFFLKSNWLSDQYCVTFFWAYISFSGLDSDTLIY